MSLANVADTPQHASGSGLRLILPSLKVVQALKGQKRKKSLSFAQDEPKPKIPRPIKLKPLKEVLTRLIAQIKKKDDYAFFLQPVDISQVPGYMDVVKRPMDLGTMTTKVEKSKYRSLEEFADDLKLVTANAKAFNPPGSIYYNEADRLETWALEHISKAAGTVIEHEADWNIDVERDDESGDGERGADAEKGATMDVDDGASVVSAQTPANAQPGRRRAGANAKKPPGALSESLEADGGLPGAKDGLGAFPPGSDFAQLMLALKMRGKRYRTKKERLRMERGGPPYSADGSLDYTELEDPFSVLQFLVPDPPARLQVTPLYPPAPSAAPSSSTSMPFPTPVTVSAAPDLDIPSLNTAPANPKKQKRRHWMIQRNPSRRGKEREEEDEDEPPWKAPRLPSATDFGAFAELQSQLSTEAIMSSISDLGSEERLCEAIRTSVEGADALSNIKDGRREAEEDGDNDEQYWRDKVGEAQAYIRDVAYGGVDGYAYARSVTEFLHLDEPLENVPSSPTYAALGMPLVQYVSQHVLDPLTGGLHGLLASAFSALRHPSSLVHAPEPVRAQIPLSLTAYPAAARALAALVARIDMAPLIHVPDELYRVEEHWAGHAYKEEKTRRAEEEKQQSGDAAAYLKFAIEKHQEAQAGTGSAKAGEEDPEVLRYVLGVVADTIEGMVRARVDAGEGRDEAKCADGTSEPTAQDVDVDMEPKQETLPPPTKRESPDAAPQKQEEEETPSPTSPSSTTEPAKSRPHNHCASLPPPQAYPVPPPHTQAPSDPPPPLEVHSDPPSLPPADTEDPAMKALRLNLLGLAKRAPLQAIAPLPAALVPEALRNIVPLIRES